MVLEECWVEAVLGVAKVVVVTGLDVVTASAVEARKGVAKVAV